jgi:succinyl-diaminopimelate desuccinylase
MIKEIIAITKKLIRFESTPSKPDEIARCFDFIKNELAHRAITYKWIYHQKFPSLVVVPANGFAPVLLMTHIDVVAAPGRLFDPIEKNGNLYGRGSIDDKYAVALCMVLLDKHLQSLRARGKTQNDLPFGVVITSDEEMGGFEGAKKALREITTDFCIVLDGGSIRKMVVNAKGLVKLKLLAAVENDGSQSRRTNESAVKKLLADINTIRNQCVLSVPKHPHRDVRVRSLRVSESLNQILLYAEAYLDVRYAENDPMAHRIEALKKKLFSDLHIESIAPRFDDGPSPYLHLLLDIAGDTAIGFEDIENDARFLRAYGINGIVWGADGAGSQHTLQEHVNIASVEKLYYILDEFLKKQKHLKK